MRPGSDRRCRSVGAAIHPSEHRVKVRSPKRAARPAEQVAEVRDYLEPRSPRGSGERRQRRQVHPDRRNRRRRRRDRGARRNPSRHEEVHAGRAGVSWPLRRHDDLEARPGSASTRVARSVRPSPAPWQVARPARTSTTCAASVTPSSGSVFTLESRRRRLDGRAIDAGQQLLRRGLQLRVEGDLIGRRRVGRHRGRHGRSAVTDPEPRPRRSPREPGRSG